MHGSDTVPAMLTPGEFVMSPEAVQRHGTGYMKSLNKGRVPGFRRGGLVGHGGVAYRANGSAGPERPNGGILSMDPTAFGQIFETFRVNFKAELENVIKPLSTIGTSLTSLVNSFSSITMTHTFNGDIGLSVNISNKDAIVAAVRVGIQPLIEGLVTNAVNESNDAFKAA